MGVIEAVVHFRDAQDVIKEDVPNLAGGTRGEFVCERGVVCYTVSDDGQAIIVYAICRIGIWLWR